VQFANNRVTNFRQRW